MALAQPQLGGVLDRYYPLALGDRARQRVQRRGLARARAAAHEDRRTPANALREEPGERLRERPVPHQLVEREALAAELADRQARAAERQGRDHHVHARPVGQSRVAHRRCLVHAPA